MRYVLALDQGTTSSRAIVFDEDGRPRGSAQLEFAQHFPSPGWVEHDAVEIWSSQVGVIGGALADAGVTADAIAAVGITNQRETTVVWDRATSEPVGPAIVWQDRRTASMCERLEAAGAGTLVRTRTGLVLDAYFSATKIAWILEHVPHARRRAEAGELAFGTIDTWLVWNLTQGRCHVTEPSNAARTMLFDIHAGRWDDELLALFGVPASMLPHVVRSSGVIGSVTHPAAGIDAPIAGIAGDQQAALFGQLCHEPGLVKNTYGTGCFMLMNTGGTPRPSPSGLLTTVAWGAPDELTYALEGSVFVGGALIQWLRDGLGIITDSCDVERLASSVPDSGGVTIVPAFVGLGAPHWDPYARGTILGLTRGTTSAHLARAALEAIAHQVADVLVAMASDADLEIRELRVDGGAAANDLLLQTQADLLGCSVVRPTVTETTALGAAYLAGLATGVWSSPAALAKNWKIERCFEPDRSPASVEASRATWAKALERSKGWAR